MVVDLELHETLKGRVRLCGSNYSKISRTVGRSAAFVTLVSQGHRVSHEVQLAIADCLSVTPQEIFPGRYPELEKP